MKTKMIAFPLMALALVASVPMIAQAYPHDPRPRDGGPARPPVPPMTAEQRAQMQTFWQEHHDAVFPLMEQLREKRMELRALSPNPNTKPEELRTIIKDIVSLEDKIDEQRNIMWDKMNKAGLPCPMGRDFDRPGPRRGDRGPAGPRHNGWGPDGSCWGPHHGYGPMSGSPRCWW